MPETFHLNGHTTVHNYFIVLNSQSQKLEELL